MAQHVRQAWRQRQSPAEVVAELEHELGLGHLTARLLALRGVSGPDQARLYLGKRLTDLHPPALLPGMAQAAPLMAAAIRDRAKILVHGDFDVDGSTSTALVVLFCRACGHDAIPFIPDRRIDGYGLGEASLRAALEHRPALLVTTDCGICDHGWAARIETEAGCRVLITDHHLPGAVLPTCAAMVNPCLPGCGYPDPGLAGVGVAWKLAWAVACDLCGSDRLTERLRTFLLDTLSLVALGTVADCAPLQRENRILVHHGLKALAASQRPGLKALRAHAGLDGAIAADEVAWKLAPLLNASGRLGSALDNVRLLTTDDEAEATRLVAGLVEQNDERRRLTDLLTGDLVAEIDSNPVWQTRASLVFAGDGWHSGVVGIVASRLAERYGKPAVVIAIRDGEGRGSLRSAGGIHLGHALDACREHLLKGGGHALAAGMTIACDRVDAFSQAFEAYVRGLHPGGLSPAGIEHDGEVRIRDLDNGFFTDFEAMSPYGHGNPVPVLRLDGAQFVTRPELFGRSGDHLRGAVTDDHGGMRPLIGWKARDRLDGWSQPRRRFDLLVRPEINRFRGEASLRLVLVDGVPC